jgi:hypothetical protein
MRYHQVMRTTLDIEEDVLLAAKEIARRQRKTAGQVLSDLARKGLRAPDPTDSAAEPEEEFFGFRPLPNRGVIVTNELIDRLREEDIY